MPTQPRHRYFIALCLFFATGYQAHSQQHFYQVYGDSIGICEGNVARFFIETSAQLQSTEWEIIPNFGATLITPGLYDAWILFPAAGTYMVVASSLTENNEWLSDTLFIFVDGGFPPEVVGCYETNSPNGCYQVCAGSQTTIIDPQMFQFEVTGAESYVFNSHPSGDQALIITWGAAGPGSVLLWNSHCPTMLCFDILPHAEAAILTSPAANNDTLTVCKGQEVLFQNQSINALTYIWNFGDGTISHDFETTHSFADEGTYTVTLQAESICDCSSEAQVVVQVLPAPAPELDCVNTVCPESRQRYTATTDGCTNYNWTVSSNGTVVLGGGPGDDFIEVIWHEGPDGFIDLSVSGCNTSYCSYSNRFRIPILTPEGPVDGDASVCPGEIVTYTAPYFPGTEYEWQIGPHGSIQGDHRSSSVTVQWHDVSSVQNSFVRVTYENCFLECNGQDQLDVSITPEIRLIGDAQVCQDGGAMIDAVAGFSSSSPANVSWHLENEQGTIMAAHSLSSSWSHLFNYPPGQYVWVATNTSGNYCSDEVRKEITITATPTAPIAIIGDSIICPGEPHGFSIEQSGDFLNEVADHRWCISGRIPGPGLSAHIWQLTAVSC